LINSTIAAWEAEHGFHPYDTAYCNDIGPGGYTYLELFLNGLMEPLFEENLPFPSFDNTGRWWRHIQYRVYRFPANVKLWFFDIRVTVADWFEG